MKRVGEMYTYLNDSHQDTLIEGPRRENPPHHLLGIHVAKKKKERDFFVFVDCRQYEGFDWGTLHSKDSFAFCWLSTAEAVEPRWFCLYFQTL